MIIIQPSFEILNFPTDAIQQIERAARTCYKSEGVICEGSASKLVRKLRSLGHFPMFDHVSASVRFICDRGVSHELVRHRIAAYAQESTRYCNYSADKFGHELTFIQPCFWDENDNGDDTAQGIWETAMERAEIAYLRLIQRGASAQEARSVLPNSLKTEIVATLDFTAWRHVLKLRCSPKAHPQMRELMIPLRDEFVRRCPEVFDDLTEVTT